MQDVIARDAGKQFRGHVHVEEEIRSKGFFLDRAHYNASFEETAYDPNDVSKKTRHVFLSYHALAAAEASFFLNLRGLNNLLYFQGVGGTGALPFFHGVGGTGALPFFQGVGGTGALPLAMITAPLSCEVTAVFRLIAPTRIIMARRTTVSLRDIECLRGIQITRRYSIYNYTNVKQLARRACVKSVHGPRVVFFA
jgi:hypothetical protein